MVSLRLANASLRKSQLTLEQGIRNGVGVRDSVAHDASIRDHCRST